MLCSRFSMPERRSSRPLVQLRGMLIGQPALTERSSTDLSCRYRSPVAFVPSATKSIWLKAERTCEALDMRDLRLQQPAAFRIDHHDAISLVKYQNTARQRIQHLLQRRPHAVVLIQTSRQRRIAFGEFRRRDAQLPAASRDTTTPAPTTQR